MKVLCKKDFSSSYKFIHYGKDYTMYKKGIWYEAEKITIWYTPTFSIDYIRIIHFLDEFGKIIKYNNFYTGYHDYDPTKPSGICHECANFKDFFYDTIELRKMKLKKLCKENM